MDQEIEELKSQLDYWGTAMQFYPAAVMNVIEIEKEIQEKMAMANQDEETDDFPLSLRR